MIKLNLLVLVVALCIIGESQGWFYAGYGGGWRRGPILRPLAPWYPYADSPYRAIVVRDVSTTVPGVRCQFFIANSTLICGTSPVDVVLCQGVANLTTSLTKTGIYGLAPVLPKTPNNQIVDNVKYRLYPLTETGTWLNYLSIVEGKAQTLSLFHSLRIKDFGIRVIDHKCYTNLIGLLDKKLDTQLVTVVGVTTKVGLLGQIAIVV